MIVLVAGFGLCAWIYLVFFNHNFWRGDQRLPATAIPLATWPEVVAIVPARNEAETIGAVTAALLAQDYAGKFRIVVVDDASTDATAALARGAGGAPAAHAVAVIAAPPLEAGWTGKLWALNAGLEHVAGDPAEFLWFTDADIVHPPATLTRLVSKAVSARRDLVSLMVRLRCESFWEHRLIPAFIFFFQMLYPFPAANDDRSPRAAAAGGCVLVRRETLRVAGGLAAIRDQIIDDCALAGAVKRAGGGLWLGLSDASHSLRRADGLGPLWQMVRRTAYSQLHHSAAGLVLTVAGLGLVFLGPPLIVLTVAWGDHPLAVLAAALAWGAMAWTYVPTLRDYGRSPWEALLLPVVAALYGAMTIDSGLAYWRRRGGHWKGRNYGLSPGPGNL